MGGMEGLAPFYLWIRALHIISVIAWMAGLLYLPRLFVYHCGAAPGSKQAETFEIMERRLLRAIMNPAMIATWVFGIILLVTPGVVSFRADFWIYPKLAAVLVLTWFHMWLAARRRDFVEGRNRVSGRAYRFFNEVPTLALVVIVVMVVVCPI